MVLALYEVLGVAGAWVLLFELNGWAFSYFQVSYVIGWVFLPAGVRLLSAMALRERGALGIGLGTLCTCLLADQPVDQSVVVASLSGAGPLLAVNLAAWLLNVPMDLQGLTPGQLAVFAFMGAVCNAVPHAFYFWAIGVAPDLPGDMLAMLTGDLLGTLIVLYGLRAALLAAEHLARKVAK